MTKESKDNDGYKGESFLSDAEMRDLKLDPTLESVIAIGRKNAKVRDPVLKEYSTRSQFPLMLAWALTVHKCQGLTLGKVVIDAGPNEPNNSVGFFFVAVTRVRSIHDIDFQPMASLVRVTDSIATKPSLFQRKRHEEFLRVFAKRTAIKFKHLNPPDSAFAGPPAAPAAPPVPRPPSSMPAKRKSDDMNSSWTNEASHAAETMRRLTWEVAKNKAVIARLGLMYYPCSTSTICRKQWVKNMRRDYYLRARVIDYGHCSPSSSETARFFSRLGFACRLDSSMHQMGVSCGYVAARVSVDLKIHADANAWFDLDVTRAVGQEWITKGNVVLGSRSDDPALGTSRFISNTEVQLLATSWWNDELAHVPESA